MRQPAGLGVPASGNRGCWKRDGSCHDDACPWGTTAAAGAAAGGRQPGKDCGGDIPDQVAQQLPERTWFTETAAQAVLATTRKVPIAPQAAGVLRVRAQPAQDGRIEHVLSQDVAVRGEPVHAKRQRDGNVKPIHRRCGVSR